MPYYRIMMKAAPGFPPECWAECDKESEIAPLIKEMREYTKDPTEPARVMLNDGWGNETLYRVDDPAGKFSPGEAEEPVYEFTRTDYGAKLPDGVLRIPGKCSQCGFKDGEVVNLQIIGDPTQKKLAPCAECLFDIAAGTQVVPMMVMICTGPGKWAQLGWNDREKRPTIGGK